jgi:hypothetical protein
MKATSPPSRHQRNFLQRLIQSATGAAETDWALIESIMRDEIFHSTLDWQSEAQLKEAARQAATRLNADRELYEFSRSNALAAFRELPSSTPSHPH